MVQPPDFTNACVPRFVLSMVIKFPAVPETVNVETVCVVPVVNLMTCGGVSTLKSLNVLEPAILNDPVPAPVK